MRVELFFKSAQEFRAGAECAKSRAELPRIAAFLRSKSISAVNITNKAKGEPLPPGVAYAASGGHTTDAAEALEGGAIATFGGHKGAGLSLVVELLAGALSGGAVLGQVGERKDLIILALR